MYEWYRRNPDLSIEAVEQCIGLSRWKWENRCSEIAVRMIDAGCAEGIARYGFYTGYVDDDCPVRAFVEAYEDGYPIRHGWIETPDGSIIDPTRWVFEGDDPYIAVFSEDDSEYDEYDPGMQRYKNVEPCPPRNDPRFGTPKPEFKPTGALLGWLKDVTDDPLGYPFSLGQLIWVAKLPVRALDGHGPELYRLLEDADLGGFIPFDNKQEVMRRRNPEEHMDRCINCKRLFPADDAFE